MYVYITLASGNMIQWNPNENARIPTVMKKAIMQVDVPKSKYYNELITKIGIKIECEIITILKINY